jgi:hypothetical protein
MHAEYEIDEEDEEQVEKGKECEDHALLDTLSQPAGLSEDREEAVDVGICVKYKGTTQAVNRCRQPLQLVRLVGLLVHVMVVVIVRRTLRLPLLWL